MSKKIKSLMEQEFESCFRDMNECLVVSIRGVNGVDNNAMRGDMLSRGMRINVVKNSLARRAFASLGMESLKDVLEGPCAIVCGGDSIIDVAKAIVGWSKNLEHIEIKGGYLEGQLLDARAAAGLSEMPSRDELQGTVVMLAQSPGSRIAGSINGPAGYIAGCIETLIGKLEDSEAA